MYKYSPFTINHLNIPLQLKIGFYSHFTAHRPEFMSFHVYSALDKIADTILVLCQFTIPLLFGMPLQFWRCRQLCIVCSFWWRLVSSSSSYPFITPSLFCHPPLMEWRGYKRMQWGIETSLAWQRPNRSKRESTGLLGEPQSKTYCPLPRLSNLSYIWSCALLFCWFYS